MGHLEPATLGILILSIAVQQGVCQTACGGFPPAPANSDLQCFTTSCIATCRGDYRFVNGARTLVLACRRNEWLPSTGGFTSIPDCLPACSPACANGQKCYFPQKECHCPDGFGGSSCQNVITCPANEFHRGCADSCKVTCRARSMGETCTSKCVEGCACSANMARNDKGKCVPLENCPCYVDGVEIADGTCSKQQWKCEPLAKGRAAVFGQKGNLAMLDGTITKYQAYCGMIVRILHDKRVIVNAETIKNLPYQHSGLKIWDASSKYLIAYLPNGIEIHWDGETIGNVFVPQNFFNKTKGIFGGYNGRKNDYLLTSDGQYTTSMTTFLDSWRVDTCNLPVMRARANIACNLDSIPEDVHQLCSKIYDSDFSECNDLMGVNTTRDYYIACVIEACACESNSCPCAVFSEYANQCSNDFSVNMTSWIHGVPECVPQCPAGQTYQFCRSSCSRSCKSLAINPKCVTECVEGCNCPEGQSLDNQGVCIPSTDTCKNASWECVNQGYSICYGYGEPAYKTFDGTYYLFQGRCSYTVVQHEQFLIEASNQPAYPENPGLCGTFNRNSSDDFQMPSGNLTTNGNTFGDSWAIDCGPGPIPIDPCNKNEQLAQLAHNICSKLESDAFQACHEHVNYTMAYRGCRNDICAMENSSSACPHFTMYAAECKLAGPTCPSGQVYQSCGDSCTRSCSSIAFNPGCESHCVEDCYCPQGQTLDDRGNCVAISTCSTCENGKWNCTDIPEATCSAVGDPHYTTFDGVNYDFQGACKYYLVWHHDFTIVGKNIPWEPYPVATLTEAVIVETFGQKIEMLQGKKTLVNSVEITSLPYYGNRFEIRTASGTFVEDDDFFTSYGQNVNSSLINYFGDSWQSTFQCNGTSSDQHPCDLNPNRASVAEEKCSALWGDIFRVCHNVVPVKTFYENCKYDLCAGGEDKELCSSLAAYASECANMDVVIDWRNSINACKITCSGGQVYKTCGDACLLTCSDLANNRTCTPGCVEGCRCPEGKWTCKDQGGSRCSVIDQQNYITFDKAAYDFSLGPCMTLPDGIEVLWNGHEKINVDIPAKFYGTTKGLCGTFNNNPSDDYETRTGSIVTTCHDIVDVSPYYEGCKYAICKCGKNSPIEYCDYRACNMENAYVDACAEEGDYCPTGQEYHVCTDPCTLTCSNIQHISSCNKKCVQSCRCPIGKTQNDNGICIPLESCPQCGEGRWTCREQSEGICSVLNNKHFKLFSGLHLDANPGCSYYLVRHEDFKVISSPRSCFNQQNGTQICLPAIIIEYLDNSMQINWNDIKYNRRIIALPFTEDGVVVRFASSSFLIVQLPNGVDIYMDVSETRIYVKVPPNFYGQIKGMCGSFEESSFNDLQTRWGDILISVSDFTSSWQVTHLCEPENEVANRCNSAQGIQAAEQKCAQLKTVLGKACSDAVDLNRHHGYCMKAACEGSDYDICTTYEAYADACASKGIIVDWRFRVPMCEMQCHGNTVYNRCANSNSLTCFDVSNPGKQSDLCLESCVCPDGFVYDDRRNCVPINQCSVCYAGQWECDPVNMGRCSMIGHSHYITFDGASFNFEAECAYYLVRTSTFSVEVQHTNCHQDFENTRGTTSSPSNNTVESLCNTKVLIRSVTLPDGAEVWLNGLQKMVLVDVPSIYLGRTEGLCGLFNNNSADDMRTVWGQVITSLETFVEAWQVENDCDSPIIVPEQCDSIVCEVLRGELFAECHELIGFEANYVACNMDMCDSNTNVPKGCASVIDYAQKCAEKGVLVNWIQELPQCISVMESTGIVKRPIMTTLKTIFKIANITPMNGNINSAFNDITETHYRL
ncbi:hypothetical protein B566_EDAN002704 [Ephemera danica]|nr:hypothetical protein B566_EDAN002704 [Ephemera danica]